VLVPAFALPYAAVALAYGALTDRVGRRRVVGVCIGGLSLALGGGAAAPGLGSLVALRVVAGLSGGGVMPAALAHVADLYAYEERGRALGVVFAALTAGLAAGVSLGPILAAAAGWRYVFAGLAALNAALVCLLRVESAGGDEGSRTATSLAAALRGYWTVLAEGRARRTYLVMVLAGLCIFGSSTWFGVYVHARFGLGGRGIGLAYLAYGLVGCMSPWTGAAADRYGRARLVPAGLGAVALGALLLAAQGSLPQAIVGLAWVALGHQLTYPLLAGLASEIVPAARGCAMGLNSFALFVGVACGSAAVGALLPMGFRVAYGAVALVAVATVPAASHSLRGER